MAGEKIEAKGSKKGAKKATQANSAAQTLSYPVCNAAGKEVGSCELSGSLFAAPVHKALVFDSVIWSLAKRRQGTHHCLTKGAMKGGGKKPWRQKGTGRARAGTNRSPLWVGGGVAHGPKSNPFGYRNRLSKRSRRQGLAAALSDMATGKNLLIVDSFGLSKGGSKSQLKTKQMIALLQACGATGKKVGLLVDSVNSPEAKAAKNIPEVLMMPTGGVNAWELLKVELLLGEKTAFESLQQQLQSRSADLASRNRRDRPGSKAKSSQSGEAASA